MIIVSIFGGLGNQMFQYATGKALAQRLNTGLKLDISYLEDKTKRDNFTIRDYELSYFKVSDAVAETEEIRKFVPQLWNCSKYDLLKYRFIRYFNKKKYYFEKQKFQFEHRFYRIKDNSYIYGYFQTEQYFSTIRQELLNTFIPVKEIDEVNATLIHKMAEEDSISIHIRRGDYESSPFSMLQMAYYLNAIEIITENVKKPVFYVFTNDYSWTEEQFSKLDINCHIVNQNQAENSYLDMVLMSKCKHNICANSSFSWWGAWLNVNPDKIVITPRQWFKNKDYASSTFDLIPEKWLQI